MRSRTMITLALVSILLLAGTASAEKEEGTERLAWGDSIYFRIDTNDDSTEVDYDVQVTDGAKVSVYYVPEKGFQEYYDDEEMTFSYVPIFSVKDTRSAKKSFTETDGGTWYIIIENADMDMIGENSTVSYKVSWEPTSVTDWMTNIGLCLAIAVVVLVVVIFVRRVRQRAEPAPPMQPYPAYQQPQQQMPMGPSDRGPGYVPPEPTNEQAYQPPAYQTPPDQAYDPTRPQEPPRY